MFDSDEVIEADILYLLKCNLSLPLRGVTVRVEQGWVTLSGRVDWPFQKEAAEWGILEHSGARGISNHIAVRPEGEAETQWAGRFRRRSGGG